MTEIKKPTHERIDGQKPQINTEATDRAVHEARDSISRTLESQEISKALVVVEKLFKNEEKLITLEGPDRKLEVELIDNQTLRITEDGEKTEFALPISVVEQIIPEEKGNPGSVTVKEGWAYTWGDKSTQEAYQNGRNELLDKNSPYSGFHDGLPERIKEGNLSVESGYLANFNNGTHFKTTEGAKIRAEEIAETTKELDMPKLDSMHGKLTPRELHLLQELVHVLNVQPYGWDKEDGPTTDDWLYSAGFTNNADSLKWAVENLPKSQEKYDAIENGWGEAEKEADRLKKGVAQSILERMKN